MTANGGFPVAPSFRHLHGVTRESTLPRRQPSIVGPSGTLIHVGMDVIAGGKRIGRIAEVLTRGAVRYLRVLRYGLGDDELFFPTGMVQVIGRDFVALYARPEDLVGSAWHEAPSDSEEIMERDESLSRAA